MSSRPFGNQELGTEIIMTICSAWVRRVGQSEELLFCSDSRLRSFGAWDSNPKIFTFSRSDCAICFAGDTRYSYPLITQLTNAINANSKIEKRFQRLNVFTQIVVKILNELIAHRSDYEDPGVEFLFGGYCWFSQTFKIWKIGFSVEDGKFKASILTNGVWKPGDFPVFFIGDYTQDAKSLLVEKLKCKGTIADNKLDFEPLEVIADMLTSPTREQSHHTIGGPPQLLKVYKSLNRVPFGVAWKYDGEVKTTLLGMPVHSLSGFNYPVIDPFSLKISNANTFR